MNCKEINKNLIGFIENTIPAHVKTEMEKHFSECESCKMLYNNIFATYTIFDGQPQTEVNPYFYARLEQKIKLKEQIKIESSTNKLIWKLQPIAASFLIVISVCAGILIGNSFSGTNLVNKNPNRTELLEAYANDYYLTDTNDDNITALINNE